MQLLILPFEVARSDLGCSPVFEELALKIIGPRQGEATFSSKSEMVKVLITSSPDELKNGSCQLKPRLADS